MNLQHYVEARSRDYYCSGTIVNIKYYVCVCVRVCFLALVIQHAMNTRRIMLSSVACQVLQNLSTL